MHACSLEGHKLASHTLHTHYYWPLMGLMLCLHASHDTAHNKPVQLLKTKHLPAHMHCPSTLCLGQASQVGRDLGTRCHAVLQIMRWRMQRCMLCGIAPCCAAACRMRNAAVP